MILLAFFFIFLSPFFLSLSLSLSPLSLVAAEIVKIASVSYEVSARVEFWFDFNVVCG